jgi:hypothetical protein
VTEFAAAAAAGAVGAGWDPSGEQTAKKTVVDAAGSLRAA